MMAPTSLKSSKRLVNLEVQDQVKF